MKNTYLLVSIFFASLFFNSNVLQAQGEELIYNNNFESFREPDFREPTVSQFQEYSFIPISHFSGKANITIPLVELDLGDLKIPIELNYNTQGIKINEVSSRVGTGWILNAGGNISKSIKGIDDFHTDFHKPSGFDELPGECIASSNYGYPIRSGWKARNLDQCTLSVDNRDIMPDVYSVAAPGLKSQFYYPESELPTLTPVLLSGIGLNYYGFSNSNPIQETTQAKEVIPTGANITTWMKEVSVNYSNNPNFGNLMNNLPQYHRRVRDYFDFKFSSTKGIEYTFNDYDVVFSSGAGVSDVRIKLQSGLNYGLITSELDVYVPSFNVSAWHLSKMKDVVTGKEIIYEYEEAQYVNSKSLLKYFVGAPVNTWYIEPPHHNDVIQKNIYLNPKRLKKITSPTTIVEFLYDTEREDLPGDYALTEVNVYVNNGGAKGNLVKKYQLNYHYMNSNGLFEEKRLMLSSVDNFALDGTKNTYELSYYVGNIASRSSANQSDWYGYYRENPTNASLKPLIYMNMGLKDFSILPISLPNRESYTNSGTRSIVPDINSMKKGMLQKITYPTKGWTELDYEPNTFLVDNHEILGGGLRIKSQKLTADGIQVRELKYLYENENGSSSGTVRNVPSYGFPSSIPPENYTYSQKQNFFNSTFLTKINSVTKLSQIQNTFVGYSRVKEEEAGKGYAINEYAIPNDFDPTNIIVDVFNNEWGGFFYDNSAIPFVDRNLFNEVRTGNLKSKSVYSFDDTILYKEENLYDYKVFNTTTYNRHRNLVFLFPYPFSYFVNVDFKSHRNLLKEKTITEYFYNPTKNIIKNTEYIYDFNLPLIKEYKVENSNGDELLKKYYYPFDNEVNNNAFMNELLVQNRSSEIIKTETIKGNELLSTVETNYYDFGNNIILPKSVSTSKGSSSLEEGSVIDLRDTKGNILQHHTKAMVYTAFIWGYNKLYPIAKVENATYASLEALSGFGTNFSITNALSTSQETTLRGLANAMVTTYTYDPLIGVTSVTDPKGYTMYYDYDEFNRLEHVKDVDRNILSKNEYNYKQ